MKINIDSRLTRLESHQQERECQRLPIEAYPDFVQEELRSAWDGERLNLTQVSIKALRAMLAAYNARQGADTTPNFSTHQRGITHD